MGANKGLISLTVKLYLRYTGSDNIKDIRYKGVKLLR